MTLTYTHKDAWITQDGQYRYLLRREWKNRNHDAGRLAFVMLNPSTADASQDDPTVRCCVAIAKKFDYNSIEIANLYSLRSPDPWALRRHDNPIGPLTHSVLQQVHCRSSRTIAAWGTHGGWNARGKETTNMLLNIPGITKSLYTLGINGSGEPRHPLRAPIPERLLRFLYDGDDAIIVGEDE